VKFNIVPCDPQWITTIDVFYDKVELWIKTRGMLNTILRLKDLRTMFYNASVNKPQIAIGFKTYKSGLPKVFGPEVNKAFILKDPRVMRFILTLFQVSRSIPAWKPVDLSPITEPSKMNREVLKEFRDSIPELFNRLPLQSEVIPWQKMHIATTMGPIGPSMLLNALQIGKFLSRFKHLDKVLQFEQLTSYLEGIQSIGTWWHKIYKPKLDHTSLRRLSTVPDSDGKNRVIGIVDYWSQSVLRNLHNDLMETLKALGGPRGPDVTFGQDIRPFGPEGEPYYSIDLTSATDRFPVEITESIIEHMYGEGVGKA